MDTSETYIKMCEKAKEIQQKGNETRLDSKSFFVNGDKRQIWLPRQDQLQEMITPWWKEKGTYGVPIIQAFYNFAVGKAHNEGYTAFNEDILSLKSWEQLWLAFVMKEKYNKIWNGEGWIE